VAYRGEDSMELELQWSDHRPHNNNIFRGPCGISENAKKTFRPPGLLASVEVAFLPLERTPPPLSVFQASSFGHACLASPRAIDYGSGFSPPARLSPVARRTPTENDGIRHYVQRRLQAATVGRPRRGRWFGDGSLVAQSRCRAPVGGPPAAEAL